MRSIRLSASILLAASLAGSLAVLPHTFRWSQKDSEHPPTQRSELRPLDAWSGRWTTQGKLFDTPYSRAGSITITMTCAWSAYNGYMICDHLFSGPGGTRNDLTVYTYSPADKSYKFYSVDQDGAPRSVPLTIAGDIWTYNSEMEKDGKEVLIRTVNDFSKPGIVTWNTKFSDDAGAHWALMNEGTDTKIH